MAEIKKLDEMIKGGKELTKINSLIVGPHVNRDMVSSKETMDKHIATAIETAKDAGINPRVIQIFISNPRNGKLIVDEKHESFEPLKKFISDNPEIKFVCHAPYTTTALWGGKNPAYAAHCLRKELKICDKLGLAGTVFHLDSHDVDDVIKGLKLLYIDPKDKGGAKYYLESSHTKPNLSHYETPEKIGKLFSAIRKEIDPELSRIGFCLDTAHIWVSGEDISNEKKGNDYCAGLVNIMSIIPAKNMLIHLNGSLKNRGSGVDEHASLMQENDTIWGEYRKKYKESGLSAFIDFAKTYQIPCVLERNEPYKYLFDYKILSENSK